MQEEDRRTIAELIIQLHNMARTMEQKASLSMRQEAYELRKVADRLSALEKSEREERHKHSIHRKEKLTTVAIEEEFND